MLVQPHPAGESAKGGQEETSYFKTCGRQGSVPAETAAQPQPAQRPAQPATPPLGETAPR